MYQKKNMALHQNLRSLQKKRTTNFREDETKLLIQLWGSPQIQNKLYLTHRKEPVMRLLAHNMQQRGFYRTPDEIKTRIRNLKCLYHRIKRTVQNGSGFGTVDPDWPHYKAMDQILSKQVNQKKDIYKDNVLEGPRCEDIKQEIDEIDINDDMESYTTNSMAGSEYEEEIQMPPLTPAPTEKKKEEKPPTVTKFPTILPNLTIPVSSQSKNNISSLPFPLLILNGVPNQEKKDNVKTLPASFQNQDVSNILKEILEVQKENLDMEKQRLELDKQRLEFERFVGSQLLALAPTLGGLLQRIALLPDLKETDKKGRKRNGDELDFLKDSKILKTLLGEGIKKLLNGGEDSDNANNDENSNCSNK